MSDARNVTAPPAPYNPRFLRWLLEVMSGWRYPLFLAALVTSFAGLMFAILLFPAAPEGMGAFAAEFRVWCFGYDPATGELQWVYVVMLIVQPLLLAGLILGLWWRPIRTALRATPRAALPVLGAALLTTAVVGAGFAAFNVTPAEGDMPFPAEALRTASPAPDLRLVDQDGRPVDLASLRGRVVVLTGVYASCGYTCPMIMAQSKRALASLTEAERAAVTIIAVTLDPAHDTPEVLARMAEAQAVAAPSFHLVTGPPPVVEGVLDHMGVARRRDPKTGIIDHTNLFLLVDRAGKVAYRFSLGERQERWLGSALRLLVAEPPPPGLQPPRTAAR